MSLPTPERSATVAAFSDTTDLTLRGGVVWTNAPGTLRVTGLYDDAGTFRNFTLDGGSLLPLRVKRIWTTGTTLAPSDILLLFHG